ncbi:translocation/assembly module TamB domain-containing protein [uncultured Desulfovibrio sp.]|uniref:translocation/assembly module TamB domain-containing protein n=1 Tax=uncultured Desulfovibrio sp. TaxID=167968 RepID=UPI002634D82E|nr:translocation/assembly module TamB [uncultured Desulfovibrio sp.]
MTGETTAAAAQAENLSLTAPKPQPPRPPRNMWRRVLRWCRRGLAGLLALALVLLGATLVALRSAGVQAWLAESVNAALQPVPGQPAGIWARVTRLSGPLPFGAEAGLELCDSTGVWLRAPVVSLDWKLGALPGAAHLSLRLSDATLLRLPETDPSPPEPPSAPLDEQALRHMLGDVTRALHGLPGWLPEVRLDALTVENFRFPHYLLGAPPAASPAQEGDGALSAGGKAAAPSKPPAAMTRADVALRLTAGTQGAQLDGTVRLAGAEGAPLLLAGVEESGLELQLDAAVTLPREGATVGLDAGAGLRARLTGAEGAASAPAGGDMTAALLGRGATLNLRLEGGLTAPADQGGAVAARAALATLQATAGPLGVEGHAGLDSRTAAGREAATDGSAASWLAGALDADFLVTLTPVQTADGADVSGGSPLERLHAPLTLHVAASGPLDAPETHAAVRCAQADMGGRMLTDALVRLDAAALRWRELLAVLDGAASPAAGYAAASPATELQLHVAAALDRQPLQGDLVLFAAPEQGKGGNALRAGLRDMRCHAPGVELSGGLAARLPVPLGAALPGVDGTVDVRAADWKALSSLVPGMKLDGEAATVTLELRSRSAGGADAVTPERAALTAGDKGNAAASASGTALSGQGVEQSAALRWRVPRLAYSDGAGTAADVRGLEGEAALTDIWGRGLVAVRLDLGRARQGDMALNAKLRAQGSLQGPLEAQLETGGFAVSRLHAVWKPGLVEVRGLEASLPGFKLGIKATPGATVAYGDAGMQLKGIDLALKPSGRVRAQGALGPEALDLRLDVEKLDFSPWKTLVDALPEGSAEAHVNVSGGMASPAGNVRAAVRGLHMPGTTVRPLNLELTGRLERSDAGGALALRLALDPASVRALGGTECRVEAHVPLLYSKDAPPKPAMQGPLRAVVRWSGEVSPLWALLPVPDQRLAGKLGIALDVSGSMEAPAARGFVKLEKGRYENVDIGVLLPSITMRVDLEQAGKDAPGAARLHLDAADGQGGTVRVSGRAGLDGKGLDITTVIDRLRPLRRRDARVDLSGRVTVRGEAAAPEVRGQLTVNQGVVLLNRLDVGGSVTTLPVREDVPAWVKHAPSAASAAPPAQARAGRTSPATAAAPAAQAEAPADGGAGLLDLRLLMPGRFLVEGFGLQSEWKADMRVTGTPAAPVISGQVEAAKGQLEILGKTFKLSRGAITFGGGNVANPLLDIVLTNRTADLTANMAVTGTVRKMQLVLSSEPSLPRDEILARMLFGKSASELGRLENLRLAAAVAQLAGFGTGDGEGGGVLDSARQALGADVLRFNASDSGSKSSSDSGDVTAGSSVEMGKYLTEDVYVGVQQGAKQGSTAFVIQLELTPRANVEVRTEQNGTKGGLTWKYDY